MQQFFRQDRHRLFLSPHLAKIDDAHERHLAFVHTLGEGCQFVFAGGGVVITLQRGRGAPEDDRAFLDLRAHHRHVARVVTRRFFLLVSCLVFFIDNDERKVFERRENGAARANHDSGATGMNFVPFIMAFASRQMAVQNGDHISGFGETSLKALNGLRRQ